MAKDTPYWMKLRDPRWQKKRLEAMERDGFSCRDCGSGANTLNVHHSYYEKGNDPWEYDNATLVTLCEDCHANRHIAMKPLLTVLNNTPHHLDGVCGQTPLTISSGFCAGVAWILGTLPEGFKVDRTDAFGFLVACIMELSGRAETGRVAETANRVIDFIATSFPCPPDIITWALTEVIKDLDRRSEVVNAS